MHDDHAKLQEGPLLSSLVPAGGRPAFNSGDFSAVWPSGVVHVRALAAGARISVRGSAELACMLSAWVLEALNVNLGFMRTSESQISLYNYVQGFTSGSIQF